jgi:hypothetical protein
MARLLATTPTSLDQNFIYYLDLGFEYLFDGAFGTRIGHSRLAAEPSVMD